MLWKPLFANVLLFCEIVFFYMHTLFHTIVLEVCSKYNT